MVAQEFDLASTVLPAAIILLAVAYDLIASLKAWQWLIRPFHDFLALDDLLEPIGPPVKVHSSHSVFCLPLPPCHPWDGLVALLLGYTPIIPVMPFAP
jgi:hypothetical protein